MRTNIGRGLGLRDFNDVQCSLHTKFTWRLLAIDNLWTRFFNAMYAKSGHLLLAKNTASCSRFWKSIMSVLPDVCDIILWKVGTGRISFWFDQWMENGPLCLRVSEVPNPLIQIRECWADNAWDFELLENLVGAGIMGEIVSSITAGKEGEDIIVWKPSTDGCFSLAGEFASQLWQRVAREVGISVLAPTTWWGCVSQCFALAKRNSQCEGNQRAKPEREIKTERGLRRAVDAPMQPIHLRVARSVSWSKPASGYVKLNVDGSCKGNLGTCNGGGVIWDSAECDSKIVVDWVIAGSCLVWYLWDFWEEARQEL
ncbi:uncharacterized protein LOC122279266 [Carya illinoinensis]|uniref:uncharacterized protein LOC122279266 n=1 Tax=Carya illinoinensis TaxID=32201 RepID=UPI001C724064|nr:uncharacterized protein LOC122279266 [Carya illinoinensis]